MSAFSLGMLEDPFLLRKDMALLMTVSVFFGLCQPLVFFAMNSRCCDDSESESGSVGAIGSCDA